MHKNTFYFVFVSRLSLILVSLVMGLLGSGCATTSRPTHVETRPSGEVLKALLAKEGNPTSYVFHTPLESVLAVMEHGAILYDDVTGDGILESTPWSRPHHVRIVDSQSFFITRYDGGRMCATVTSFLHVHLMRLGDGTRVDVEGDHKVNLSYPGSLYFTDSFCECPQVGGEWGCLPLCPCVWLDDVRRNGIGRSVDTVAFPVPSDTVGEYELLLAVGHALGEQGMPEIKHPQIEVIF